MARSRSAGHRQRQARVPVARADAGQRAAHAAAVAATVADPVAARVTCSNTAPVTNSKGRIGTTTAFHPVGSWEERSARWTPPTAARRQHAEDVARLEADRALVGQSLGPAPVASR